MEGETMSEEPNAAGVQQPVIRRFVATITRQTPLGFPVHYGVDTIGGCAADEDTFRAECVDFLSRLGDGDVYSVSVDRAG